MIVFAIPLSGDFLVVSSLLSPVASLDAQSVDSAPQTAYVSACHSYSLPQLQLVIATLRLHRSRSVATDGGGICRYEVSKLC